MWVYVGVFNSVLLTNLSVFLNDNTMLFFITIAYVFFNFFLQCLIFFIIQVIHLLDQITPKIHDLRLLLKKLFPCFFLTLPFEYKKGCCYMFVLIFYPVTLQKMFTICRSSLVEVLVSNRYACVCVCVYHLYLTVVQYLSYSQPFDILRIYYCSSNNSSTTLSRHGQRRHSHLVLNFSGNALLFSMFLFTFLWDCFTFPYLF